MKKILTILALIPLACSALPQDLKNSLAGNPEVAIPLLLTSGKGISPHNVSPKAVNNFHKTFKNASDERWFALADAIRVKFAVDGIPYVADYDKKGNWLHTIRTYFEKDMPADVRQQVKTTYFDYSIICVKEITLPHNDRTYVVYLEGVSDYINLRIANGDIDERQRYKK